MSFGWDLPPGVSDSDFEPNDPKCASCGHLYSEHLGSFGSKSESETPGGRSQPKLI